jgi:hypothetical protein
VAPPIITTATESTSAAMVAPGNILMVECPCCGARSHVEAPVRDLSGRLGAIELLLREGLGRPQQVDDPGRA